MLTIKDKIGMEIKLNNKFGSVGYGKQGRSWLTLLEGHTTILKRKSARQAQEGSGALGMHTRSSLDLPLDVSDVSEGAGS